MHDIAFFTSPFDLSRREFFSVQVGHTIREALIAHDLLERMNENAVLVACNGVEFLESQWDKVIDDADIITLHLLPQGPAVAAWIVANWVTIAYVIVTALYISNLPEPEVPGSIAEASPSYSISARGNASRLGSPKPVFYGRVRTWPDLSSMPFTEFLADSTQVLYQLYEVRQGAATINVSDMRIEDTPLSGFSDYEVEVIQPGEKSTLFPSQMVTSNEFNNLKIVETMNSYVACDIGQRTTRLIVDIVAAGGVFGIKKKNGNLSKAYADFYVEAQQIDDDNNPLGGYVYLTGKPGTDFPYSDSWEGSTRDVIRRSLSYPVAEGRYRVRVRLKKTGAYGNVDDYQLGGDGLTWVGLRAMLVDEMPVTTTTRIALKIRASEQLGGKSLGRFNCISTGKISTWNPTTGWSAPTVTANPAWVFADVARNTLYGGTRDDAFIDLAGLYALAAQLDTEGIRFDGGFDTSTTVWDALTKVAAVAQAVPVDRAGIYYMVRDVQGSPSYMFTHSNIVRDSFKISYVSVLDETADSVRVNFFDETNDYRINSILCNLPGSTTNTTRDITLFGCTNKDRAFKWGMYLAAMNQYRRISVEFDTGIEGYLPFFYDTVAVSHYLVGRDSVAQVSGDVIAFDGSNILTLSEKVSGLTTPYIIIRGLDGSPSSPYSVTVLDDYRVQIAGAFDTSRLVFDAGFERPYFMCGEGTQFYARIKINKISPQGNGVYRIGGFIDAPEVYAASSGLPTPPVNILPAVVNRKPLVEHLAAALSGTVDSILVTLSWSGRYSDYYIVEYSTDAGTTWLSIDEGKFITTFVEHLAEGVVHYRVAGVSTFRGDFVTLVVDTAASPFVAPTPVSGVHLASAFIGPYATILWTSAYTDHHVKIKIAGVVLYELDVAGNSLEINSDTAAKYGLGRSFDIEVFSIASNGLYSTTAGTLSVSNPSPAAITGILTVAGYSQIHLEWNASTETDLGGYQVWMSGTSGFTPGAGNLIYDGIENKLIIRTLNGGTPIVADTPYYLRVAAYDQFGKTGLTISSEFSSTPLKIATGIGPGEIIGTMVAAGAFDMTKFASGIRPSRVVPTLPTIDGITYINGDTVTLTTDGQLYRAFSGAWVNAIPAVNITGTLTDSQLAAIAAAKITGTLTDSQLAAIASTKITGTLTDTQLAAISASKVTGTLADTQLAAISAAKVTGQITTTQITNNAITTSKLATGAVTANEIAANTITAAKIASGAITATEIAAGTITSSQIATDTILAGNIAANAITSSELAAGAVVAGKITAGTIVAADIAASTITGSKIAANTITASNIAADTITANEIAASAITATELAAGAVTTAKISAGAVTANEIAANTITAGKIAAGAIGATQIAANAITSDKIFVRKVAAALNDDPNFADATAWSFGATAIQDSGSFSTGQAAPTFVRCGTSTNVFVESSKSYVVIATKTYLLTANLYAASGNNRNVYVYIDFYDASGSVLASTSWGGSRGGYVFGAPPTIGSWNKVGGQFGAGTAFAIPSSATQCRIGIWFQYSGSGSSSVVQAAQDLRLEEVLGGTLIQDGAITTNKIAANTIVAGNIASNTITAAQIAANTITGSQVAANTITATNIDSRSLSIKDAGGTVIFSAGVPLTSAFADQSLANGYDAGSCGFVSRPAGGAAAFPTASVAGAIRIILPQTFQNTMIRLTISIYEFNTGNSSVYEIAGYLYSVGNTWLNCTVNYRGVPSAVRPVYLGNIGSYGAIHIGNTGGAWQYPNVTVTNVQTSYQNYSSSSWSSGWQIVMSTSGMTATTYTNTSPTVGGAMSGIDQITSGNASTYIANAAINTAQIGVLNASVIQAGTISTDKITVGAVTASQSDNNVFGSSSFSSATSQTRTDTAISSFTGTGAASLLRGSVMLDIGDDGSLNKSLLSTVDYVVASIDLKLNGTTVKSYGGTVRTCAYGTTSPANGRFCQITLPIQLSVALTGSNTFTFVTTITFYNSSGVAVSSPCRLDVNGIFNIQENKV